MRARAPEDRLEFYLAIERVAPQVWRDLRDLAAGRKAATAEVTREDVEAFLTRHGIDPACTAIVDEVLLEARSDPVGIPGTVGGHPSHGEVLRLRWEPADTSETRGAFLQRARSEIEAYADHVEAWMRDHDVTVPTPERARGKIPKEVRRWDILVRYLVLGETYERIAVDVDGVGSQVTAASVGEHVRDLAERLGIPLKAN